MCDGGACQSNNGGADKEPSEAHRKAAEAEAQEVAEYYYITYITLAAFDTSGSCPLQNTFSVMLMVILLCVPKTGQRVCGDAGCGWRSRRA